jgi:hypothetical protein
LVGHAEAWLREQGMAVVFIGTGGDPGHAPARDLYESLGYRPFPSAQYFRVLPDSDWRRQGGSIAVSRYRASRQTAVRRRMKNR